MVDRLYLEISVTDPTKQSDLLGKSYTTYKVATKTNKPGFTPGECIVIRRYSDFDWLFEEFAHSFPGVITPPLPEKRALRRFDTEFVDFRRKALQKFLERSADHVVLCGSLQFVSFLQSDDAGLNQLKGSSKAFRADAVRSEQGWLSVTINSLQVPTKRVEPEKSIADEKLGEICGAILNLEKQLNRVIKHADYLLRSHQNSASTLLEFGQMIVLLGQSNEGDVISSSLIQVGWTTETLFTLGTKHSEEETNTFIEPMKEYIRYIASIKAALQRRAGKKLSYISRLKDVEVKQQSYDKAAAQPGTAKEIEVSKKLELLESTKEAADKAKIELQNVSEQLLIEYENFMVQKANDFKNIFVNFIALQIELSKQVEKAWVDLLPSLKDIDVGVAASAQLSSLHPPKYVTASGGNEAAIGRGGGLSVTHGDLDDQECKEDEEEVLSV